jgi:hypothetical protein
MPAARAEELLERVQDRPTASRQATSGIGFVLLWRW